MAWSISGVIVIGESDGMGAGVRLKFTRQDVKQIGRLESEAGSSALMTRREVANHPASKSEVSIYDDASAP